MMAHSSEKVDFRVLGGLMQRSKNSILMKRVALQKYHYRIWVGMMSHLMEPLTFQFSNPLFYFPPFYFKTNCDEQILAKSFYGVSFTSAAKEGHILGVQFHPEKSHDAGMQMLLNFARL